MAACRAGSGETGAEEAAGGGTGVPVAAGIADGSGEAGEGGGDRTNWLTREVGDPNTTNPEYQDCLVDIRKADKVTELAR